MNHTNAIVAAGLLAVNGLALAAEPVFEFECDTPAGHYSHWSQTLDSGKLTVEGTVTIHEKREHDRWNPVASALFIGNPSGGFGLQIYTLKAQQDVLLLRITEPQTRDETPFAMLAGDTKSIPFSLTLGKDGRLDFVTVVLGDARMMFMRGAGAPATADKQPVEIYLQVDDVDAYHDRVRRHGVTITDPLTMQWWGDRTFKLRDPNGYEIWFYTNVAEPVPPQGAKLV